MANQMGWREAWGAAWNKLTGVDNEGSAAGVRLLFFLLFLLGTLGAGYRYYEMQLLGQEKTFVPSTTPQNVESDKSRLDAMIEQVRSASALRSSSFVWARSMKDLGKNIFDDPTRWVEAPGTEGTVLPQIDVVVEPPPDIVIRAIMILGKERKAVMDIAGLGSGMIVRQGDTFMGKKGRIVRILADKVVVRWAGRNWDIAPGF